MADQGPLSNTVLGGRYRLGVRLGSGGFADVYLAEHIHLKTQCAIKVLTRRLTSEEIEQFRREAQTIAALDHPHILRVRDFDLENGFPFLVMDYAPNGTLRSRHPRGTRLPLATVVSYLKQIADALQHAHDQKLIHRDLKPENLLIGKRDEILLSDFGIAIVSQSTSLQPTQGYAGTAAYSAPEQLKGKPQRASDQYALGIIIYEWLAGELPFKGSFVEVFGQHLYEPPPPLRDKVSTLPSEVEQVLLTALAKDPKERFATVQAFANALEQAYQASSRPPLGTTLLTYRGHTEGVHCIAWSPDGRYIASGGQGKTVQVWEANTGKHILTYEGHNGEVNVVAWSPDGELIASGSDDNTIQIWNASTGKTYRVNNKHPGSVKAVIWSSDGRHILSGGERPLDHYRIPTDNASPIRFWEVATGKTLSTYGDGLFLGVLALARSADGNKIAFDADASTIEDTEDGGLAQDRNVEIYDVVTGKKLLIHKRKFYIAHDTIRIGSERLGCLAWSPNGRWIASHTSYDSDEDGAIEVWDAETGNSLLAYRGHTGLFPTVVALAWSPDGNRIASAGVDKTVQIWEATTGKNLFTYRGHADGVNSIAWSPDGTRIASGRGGYFVRDCTVQVWQAV